MSVEEKITNLINELKNEPEFLPYLYNTKKKFEPGKSWIYYSGPVWDETEAIAGVTTFLTGKWIPAGEKVDRFEKAFSKKFDLGYSLMVNSGSSANLVLISAVKKHLGWSDGDEVIASAVGFPTTVAPLMQCQLKPVLTDITMDDLNFDLDHVEKCITPKTKAIFLSPVLGNAPDMDRLVEICEKNKITLLLDGCDSLGSQWKGKDLASYAYATSCSFYPAHHITTGEGGMVSSHDKELLSIARSFAWWGRDCYCVGAVNLSPKGSCGNRFDKWLPDYDGVIDHKYLFTQAGFNLKPLDMQGAIGLIQLEKVDMIHEKRVGHKNRIASMFIDILGSDWVSVPGEHEHASTSWFGVPIICHKNKLKEQLVQHLEFNKIQTRNYFAGNMIFHPAYAHLGEKKDFPHANRVLDEVFFVGCHPTYTEEHFEYYESVLRSFKEKAKDLF